MEKLESHTSTEAAWRRRLQQHAQSGKSIAAFRRDEIVSTASFHMWRAKLAAADGHLAQPTAFIDLGAIKDTTGVVSAAPPPASAPVPGPAEAIESRISDTVQFADGVENREDSVGPARLIAELVTHQLRRTAERKLRFCPVLRQLD